MTTGYVEMTEDYEPDDFQERYEAHIEYQEQLQAQYDVFIQDCKKHNIETMSFEDWRENK
jgi:hypothetical protein